MKLYPSRPEVPIDKLSFNSLCEILRNTQSPSWCEYYGSPHQCNLNTTVVEIVAAATAGATGLDLMEIKQGRVVSEVLATSDSSDIF
jgi:hypothetical protein